MGVTVDAPMNRASPLSGWGLRLDALFGLGLTAASTMPRTGDRTGDRATGGGAGGPQKEGDIGAADGLYK